MVKFRSWPGAWVLVLTPTSKELRHAGAGRSQTVAGNSLTEPCWLGLCHLCPHQRTQVTPHCHLVLFQLSCVHLYCVTSHQRSDSQSGSLAGKYTLCQKVDGIGKRTNKWKGPTTQH